MTTSIDTLVENAVVKTMDANKNIFMDGSIAIRGKEIIDIGTAAELKGKYQAARTINGKNKLAMPGLINSHTHISGALSRGMIDDLSFTPWVQKKNYIMSRALDEENYYISAMQLCLEMLKTGTTCFVDCGTVQGLESSAVKAIEKIGIKAVLGRLMMDVADSFGTANRRREGSTEENLTRGEEFIQKWHNAADGRIQAWLCPIQVSSISNELCIESVKLAKKYGVGILTHASVTPEDVEPCIQKHGTTPIDRFYRLGVLGPNFLAAHAGWITEREMKQMKETDANISHVPSASMKCGYGSLSMGKFPELVSMGVNVGLGSDGPSASSFQDMVRTMYMVAGGHKEARLDPRIMDPEIAVEMATVNNAKALLWSDKIGTLEKGKRADIVLFDLMRPEWIPWNESNLTSNLVYAASGNSADTVIIDGEIVVEGGELKTADEREIMEKAQEAGKKFQQLAGEWEAARPKPDAISSA